MRKYERKPYLLLPFNFLSFTTELENEIFEQGCKCNGSKQKKKGRFRGGEVTIKEKWPPLIFGYKH